jgi:hypothetical protein
MVALVSSDLSVSSSDPVGVAGSGEVLSGELAKSVGAERSARVWRKRSREDSLELVLEVLEGQGVLEDSGVIDTAAGHVGTITRHSSPVDGVGGGHGDGGHGRGESKEDRGQHCGLVGW